MKLKFDYRIRYEQIGICQIYTTVHFDSEEYSHFVKLAKKVKRTKYNYSPNKRYSNLRQVDFIYQIIDCQIYTSTFGIVQKSHSYQNYRRKFFSMFDIRYESPKEYQLIFLRMKGI